MPSLVINIKDYCMHTNYRMGWEEVWFMKLYCHALVVMTGICKIAAWHVLLFIVFFLRFYYACIMGTASIIL